jgi:hypothetical protein
MNFTELLALADRALNYLTEGKALASQLATNYAQVKDTLSDDEQSELDARLRAVQEKSAEVHTAIQQQG